MSCTGGTDAGFMRGLRGGLLSIHGCLLIVILVLMVPGCVSDGGGESPGPGSFALPDVPPPGEEDRHRLAARMRLDDPPEDVEFERYISLDEFAAVMVPCLVEQGMPARVLPDGGIGWGDIPPEQGQAQSEALYRCYVRFPTHTLFEQPLNADQLRRLYEYQAGELTACLEGEGYTVPPPPSAEAFIESYYDPAVVTCHPYPVGDPRLGREAEWHRLNEVCPQNPPLDVLYGP